LKAPIVEIAADRGGMSKPFGAAIAAAVATLLIISATASAAATCSLVASPTGSDAASGSVSAPFHTAQKLVDSLAPGQVGCLRGGNYSEDVEFSRGGEMGSPVTLTSYPGETATITGRLWIAKGANDVTVTGLHLVGVNSANLPSPTVNADDATFSYDDVTDEHTGICFAVGDSWGSATNTLITHSRIHGCGVLPAENHDHGIYVADATGTRIEWNLIYDNADRGVQLYPDAQNTTIDHNVIADNGEGILFSGDDGSASNNASVYANVVSGSIVRHDVESYYPSGNPVGTGNVVHDNCLWGGAEGTIDTSAGGFTAEHNVVANPEYVSAATHDYRLASTSPCLAVTGDIAAAVDGSPTTSGPSFRPVPSANARAGHPAVARIALIRRCKVHGRRCTAYGHRCKVHGRRCTAYGHRCTTHRRGCAGDRHRRHTATRRLGDRHDAKRRTARHRHAGDGRRRQS